MFTLLHIDNNLFYREILHNLTAERDFEFFSAKTPEAAYDIIANNHIDIIVTGLEFEHIHEESFIKELKSRTDCSTSIIVLSATDNTELKNILFNLGVAEYISKEDFLKYFEYILMKLSSSDLMDTKLKSLNIAVLDDNNTHIELMKEILSKREISSVQYFLTPEPLLDSPSKFDIYFIDYILPSIDGEQVIKNIRSKDEYAVIIAVSSISSQAVISNILEVGADDYITKPFSENILLARLKANVRTYNLMQSLKEKNEILNRVAKEDVLTTLYNRRHVMDMLAIEMDRAKRYQSDLSILMFDIDHFKNINDKFGHHIGDQVLKRIGQICHDISRTIDIPGRYGGDEFVIILPNTDLNGAMIYAERLRKDIENSEISKNNIKFTISGGIAIYKNQSINDFIKEADLGLYRSKQLGRNRFSYID